MLNEPPWPESIAWWATVPHCLPSGIVVGPDGAKLYVTLAHTLHTMRGRQLDYLRKCLEKALGAIAPGRASVS
jgi:hypothetical protein